MFLDMSADVTGVAVTITYVTQYESSPGRWQDLCKRGTPEEAFGRLDVFRAAWDGQDGLQDLQVVRREITDTVIEDPRPAGQATA
jgi:hypothetical protein